MCVSKSSLKASVVVSIADENLICSWDNVNLTVDSLGVTHKFRLQEFFENVWSKML